MPHNQQTPAYLCKILKLYSQLRTWGYFILPQTQMKDHPASLGCGV